MKVVILGCGASPGVPIIGCNCQVCTSNDPRNKRSRASIYVEHENTHILIDTSPDMRQQFIANGLIQVDAIIYSHAHADHTHGIDDVRSFNYQNGKPIPAYMDKETEQGILKRFSYAFLEPIPEFGWFRPCLEPIEIQTNPFKDFLIGNVTVTPFEQIHGRSRSLGFRIADFAYSTDVSVMPEQSLEKLKGIQTWVVDCLQYQPAPTHAHLELTLEWINRIKPKRAILTHMSHLMGYAELTSKLPRGVEPAYDGMIVVT